MAQNTWTDITCPPGCETDLELVAIPADQNCIEVPLLSQVSDLYITPTGASEAFDWTVPLVPTYLSAGIDNTDTNNAFTKWIVGQGGVAEPELTPWEGPKGATAIIKRTYTLEFEVNVKNEGMRNMLRQLQCNWRSFKFWYGTRGGKLYGGENGIVPASTNAVLALGAGAEDFEMGRIIIVWETTGGAGDPPRTDNPQASV